MKHIRWQDWANVLLGCWLLASPSQMAYSLNHSASSNAYGLGATLIVFNLMAVARILDEGQEILNILFGVWLMLSPYALDFAEIKEPTVNAIAVGAMIIVLAGWQIYDAARSRTK